MEISLPTWAQTLLTLAAAAAIIFIAWKYGSIKGQGELLNIAKNERDLLRESNERKDAEAKMMHEEIKTAAKELAEAKAKCAAAEAKVTEIGSYLKMDTVSPALITILSELAKGNMAQYTKAMSDLQHYIEAEFTFLREKAGAVDKVIKQFESTTERRTPPQA